MPVFPMPPLQTIHVVHNPGAPVAVRRGAGETTFFFVTKLDLDVDGAPTAYHPATAASLHGTPPALDDLRNAGVPGPEYGIAHDPAGNRCVQGVADPAPGYYVSQTSLVNRAIASDCNPAKYVDATAIPYFVLPHPTVLVQSPKQCLTTHRIPGRACLGDFGVTYNQRNGKLSYAIYADNKGAARIGEGSVALARALGIPVHPPQPKGGGVRGGQDGDVWFIVFPDSGNHNPRPISDINARSAALFTSWGGQARIADLLLTDLITQVSTITAITDPTTRQNLVDMLRTSQASLREPLIPDTSGSPHVEPIQGTDDAVAELQGFIDTVGAVGLPNTVTTTLQTAASQIRIAIGI